jgi:hypothetical protein
MIESLILIQGNNVKKEALGISLMNAKQLIIGNVIGFGTILHVAANAAADLNKALLDFAKVAGVTGVITLMVRNP